MSLKANDWFLEKKEKQTQKHKEEDHVKTEVEIGVKQPSDAK